MTISAIRIGEVLNIPFDADQIAAIEAPFQPNVVIAGAGAGKTSVMAARVVYLVANNYVRADEVLGLTFTNLATASLQKKIREALNALLGENTEDSGEPTVSTYHSFAQSIVKNNGLRIGIEPDADVLSDVRREQLASYVIQKTKVPLADLDMAFSTVLDYTLKLDDRLADYDLATVDVRTFNDRVFDGLNGIGGNDPTRDIPANAKKRNYLLEVVEEFRAYKKATDNIDYADMTRLSLLIARQYPAVISELRQQFKLVMLDEYQDTSVAQRKLMSAIFGDGHPVTAVGDPLQSIYSFRGASPYNIEQFVSHFPLETGETSTRYALPTTRRNGRNIVAIANAVSERLRQPDAHPHVQKLVAGEPSKYGPGNVAVTCHKTSDDELHWIANHIRQAQSQGVPLEEMAILLRKNEDVAWFYRMLSANGIPAQVRTKQDLLNIPEIAELIAYLRIIAEPAANSSWVRILTGARWRIGNRDLALIGQHAQQLARIPRGEETHDLAQTLQRAVTGTDSVDVLAYGDALEDIARNPLPQLSAQAQARIEALTAEVAAFRRMTGDDLMDLVYRVAVGTGLLNESQAHNSRVKLGMVANLRSFFNMVADFKALDGSSTLFSFLRFLRDAERHESQPQIMGNAHKGAVQLMTMHAAKGLEFRLVALPRFAEGVFPSSKSADRWTGNASAIPFALRSESYSDSVLTNYPPLGAKIPKPQTDAFVDACKVLDELDERRLAYVAITRAMETLLISTASYIEGEKDARPVSPFLIECQQAALEIGQITTPWFDADGDDETEIAPVSGQWPVPMSSDVMQQVREAAELVYDFIESAQSPEPSQDPLVQAWDDAILAIQKELQRETDSVRTLTLPTALSVTQVQKLAADEQKFIDGLIRPMPQEPAPAAAQGTTFHAWVEQRSRTMQGVGAMPTLPGMEDFDDEFRVTLDTTNLKNFQQNFESSQWATKVPKHVEHPFQIMIAGRLIRGKIDAIYQDGDEWILVDWKTNSTPSADPLQLSIYRAAWAEENQIPLESIKACFYYVALNATVYADDLLSRDEIAKLLG